MIEIRIHGRGGQGAVVASRLLAEAAFREGMDVQAFPHFGVERRGAPVTAFTKLDKKPIRIKSQIYEPDYVIVMDPSLMGSVDMTAGLKDGGLVIVNTGQAIDAVRKEIPAKRIALVDATGIAIDHKLGSRENPIVNTAILGAFAKVSGLVSWEKVSQAIHDNVPRKPEENVKAAKAAWDTVTIYE